MNRIFYVAAYDIVDPRRLQQALQVLKGYSTGGQKSVFECFLSEGERRQLLREVAGTIEPAEDRFLLIPASVDERLRTLGIAVRPDDPPFFYIG